MHVESIQDFAHDHDFGQGTARRGERRTQIVIALTAFMMVAEIAGGMIFGSMALLADGVHMASHAVALGIAALAYAYARRHAGDRRFSFGTGKVNALAGFTGAVLLAGFALVMAVESLERIAHPVSIAFNSAIAVAVVGLVVNAVSALVLGGGHHEEEHGHHHGHGHGHGHGGHGHHDHNLRAAYLHVLADALTSLTAIFALLTGKYLGWGFMDPLMGVAGSVLVANWSWGLLKETSRVLLDHQQDDGLRAAITHAIEDGTTERVADLHLWSVGTGLYAVILSVVSHEPREPSHYKARLPTGRGLVHVTVEVQHCNHDAPVSSAA